MYDYVTREFDLTPEEQEKAKVMLYFAEKHHRAIALGQPGRNAVQEQAFLAFKNGFYLQLQERLGQPDELRGGWNISEDGSKVIVCQVKWVG